MATLKSTIVIYKAVFLHFSNNRNCMKVFITQIKENLYVFTTKDFHSSELGQHSFLGCGLARLSISEAQIQSGIEQKLYSLREIRNKITKFSRKKEKTTIFLSNK